MSNEKLRKETENVIRKLWAATLAYFRSIDRWFALLYVLLCGYGLLVVAGVAHSFSPKSNMLLVQASAMLIGAAAVIIISKFDYHSIARLWKLYLPAVLALVALTFVVGAQRGGADDRAWLLLPGGLSLQPSEFLKIAFILTFALHIYVVGDRLNRPLNVLLLCLNGAWPVLLIHLQGDDGSALIFFVIFLVMAFCGGLAWPYMLAGLGLIGAAVPVMWNFVLNADQKQRIEALITPGSDPLGIELQQNKARISIGSGQFFGRGLFAGDHNYVPEIQNDFIFSFIGEALGFVGCLLVFALFVLLFARTSDLRGHLRNACRAAPAQPRHEPRRAAGHRRYAAVLLGGRLVHRDGFRQYRAGHVGRGTQRENHVRGRDHLPAAAPFPRPQARPVSRSPPEPTPPLPGTKRKANADPAAPREAYEKPAPEAHPPSPPTGNEVLHHVQEKQKV